MAKQRDGSVSVSGPGVDRDGLPNVHVGVSLALTAATRHSNGTWYVRDAGEGRYAVEHRADATVVLPLKGGGER